MARDTGDSQNEVSEGRLTRGDNNDHQKNNDANDQTHAHLHVLPPHIFAHAIGAAAEALGRDGQVVGLVLQGIEVLTTLRDLVDVFAHHTDGVIDLLEETVLDRIRKLRPSHRIFHQTLQSPGRDQAR